MITCIDLKRCCQQIFTYSARYQAPFYGREKSIAEMQEKVGALQPGETLLISQPLGTGKTFLVTHMISEGRINVPRGASFLTARGIAETPESIQRFPGDILIVDEADVKTVYKKLTAAMEILQRYLDETGKMAIVIGDYTLRDLNLRNRLSKPKLLLNFEPIDRDFLYGSIMQRFQKFMSEIIDKSFHLEDVLDPQLLEYLTPTWMLSVNNFRGIFSLFQDVVSCDKYVKYNSSKAYLELSMFKEFLSDDDGEDLDTEEQIEFLRLLKELIVNNYPKGTGITRGFQKDELYQLAQNGGIDVEYDNFYEDILNPLTLGDYLVSAGIPTYQDGEFIRRPEPYVPSLRLLLATS